MPERIDQFSIAYSKFTEEVVSKVRRETFGDDIGQNSWTLKQEYEGFLHDLQVALGKRLLDVACGAGGPALFSAGKTGCSVVGIDINADGIATAKTRARELGLADRAIFQVTDVGTKLPFDNEAFDAIICVEAVIHFSNRSELFREWRRVLREHCRVLFTDPVVITGLVTDEELATRSSIAKFVFSPPGEDERLLKEAKLKPLRIENSTSAMGQVARAWRASRARHEDELVKLEGPDGFRGLQKFFDCVSRLSEEKRMSRFTILAERG